MKVFITGAAAGSRRQIDKQAEGYAGTALSSTSENSGGKSARQDKYWGDLSRK